MKLIYKSVLIILFIVYILILLEVVIFKYSDISYIFTHLDEIQYSWNNVNLVPFNIIKDIYRNYDNYSIRFVYRNIYGNVLAFIPFGFFIRMFLKNNRIRIIGCVGMLLSLVFELFQGVTMSGTMDIDDVILNTLGTVLGGIIHIIICKAIGERSNFLSIRE